MNLQTFIEVSALTIDDLYNRVMLASVGRYHATADFITATQNVVYRDVRGGKFYDLTTNIEFIEALDSL